jgi:hypothetical protein
MKAISQPSAAARELRGYASAPLARSRNRELHCMSALSLSCLCRASSRCAARRLGACAPRVPSSSFSSSLASSRRSFERYVTDRGSRDTRTGHTRDTGAHGHTDARITQTKLTTIPTHQRYTNAPTRTTTETANSRNPDSETRRVGPEVSLFRHARGVICAAR